MADDKELMEDVSVDAEDEFEEEEDEYITLEFDDGDSVECFVIGVFDCDGKDYIALAPQEETDDVYLYRYIDNGETFDLEDIDDEEEFNKVAKEFDEIMDEAEEDHDHDHEE